MKHGDYPLHLKRSLLIMELESDRQHKGVHPEGPSRGPSRGILRSDLGHCYACMHVRVTCLLPLAGNSQITQSK